MNVTYKEFKLDAAQAGSLLGLGALLFSSVSNAAVISSSTPSTLKLNHANSSKSLALTGTGVTLTNSSTGSNKSYASALTLTSPTGFVTSNVGAGTVIGAHLGSSSGETLSHLSSGKAANTSAFSHNGLYGYSFVDSNNITNYGWANVTLNYDGHRKYNSLVATVNAFAHTTAGENIIAGAPTATSAVPEADGLALLASGVGLIGLTVHRRRKSYISRSSASLPLAA